MTLLDDSLAAWLDDRAEALDTDASQADGVLPRLAATGLLRVGVPLPAGGSAGSPSAAIGVVAALARHSLSAAFVYWAQRACIECVLAGADGVAAGRLLPALLDGSLAGAPALSNAMKSLGGFDTMKTRVVDGPGGARLDGAVAWATNLHRRGFVAVLAAADAHGGAAVYALPHDAQGLVRAPDLDLAGLRATNTAALRLDGVPLDERWRLHPRAADFLPAVRPAFIGLQCGLGLGLARASLASARSAPGAALPGLAAEHDALAAAVDAYWRDLSAAADDGKLAARPARLLALRVRMVELATAAVQLELQALGGRAFARGDRSGFLRRWRESAFLPVLTPTLAQLKSQLNTQARAPAVASAPLAEDR